MNILINYKKKFPSKEIPNYLLDISDNIPKKNIELFKSKLPDTNLFTIIDFNSYNYFKNFILTGVIKHILSLYPTSTIKIINLNLDKIIFQCSLKPNKQFDASYIAVSMPSKISNIYNHLISITCDDRVFQFLFINKIDLPINIKNTISKIKYDKLLNYYESDIFGNSCHKFLKSFYDSLNGIPRKLFPINSPYFKSIKNKSKFNFYKFKKPDNSPSLKPFIKKTNSSFINYHDIQPFIHKPPTIISFSTTTIDKLEAINLKHYQNIIQVEKTIESYHNGNSNIEDIKYCIQDKIRDIEDYLQELKKLA